MHITKSARRVTMGLLAIPLIYLFIWRILPMLYTAFLSMTDYNMIWDKKPTFVLFDTYKKIFSDYSFIESIIISLKFAILAVSVQYLLGCRRRLF